MASELTIRFIDVGRERRTWSAPLPCPADNIDGVLAVAEAEVRRRGGLLSRDVDVVYVPTTQQGSVYVGLVRKVGRFVVETTAPGAPEVG